LHVPATLDDFPVFSADDLKKHETKKTMTYKNLKTSVFKTFVRRYFCVVIKSLAVFIFATSWVASYAQSVKN